MLVKEEYASQRRIFERAIFQLYYDENKSHWQDDDVCFVLDQHAKLDFYSASSVKQQSMGRHVDPFGHINPIPSQQVFDLTPW